MLSGNAYIHMFSSAQPVCLSVGAFNPFIFKVIIDIYDPITVFLIVLGIFYRWVFSFSCFLSREVPLAFVVKLV